MSADTEIAETPENDALERIKGFVLDSCQAIGHSLLGFFEGIGRLAFFTGVAVARIFTPPLYPRLTVKQFIDIGYYCPLLE